MNEIPSKNKSLLLELSKIVVKVVLLIAGWGIAIVILIGFLIRVTEGKPIMEAIISGIVIVLILIISEFIPKEDYRREKRYQVIYYIKALLIFLTLILFIGMAQESLTEMGFKMVAPPSP